MIQFDIHNRVARMRMIRYMDRQRIVYERFLTSRVKKYLLSIYTRIAHSYETGIANWEFVLSDTRPLYSLLMNFYQRIFIFFSDLLFDSVREHGEKNMRYSALSNIMQKDLRDVFWSHFRNYIKIYCAQRVSDISKVTRKRIQRTINVGMEEEIGRQGITKNLLALSEIDSKIRARRIANTETHSGSSMAIHEAAKQEHVLQEHEWATAHDERVRQSHTDADGQRIPVSQPFQVGGELLDHPGDPKGSAGNIINCRCVELFHTIREGLNR